MASQIARALPAGVSFFKPPKSPDDRQRTGRLKRSPIKRAGKKVEEWDRIRAVLKKRFHKAGILSCELAYEGCWRTSALGFCHSKKRRNCSEKDLWTAILGCNVCHDKIEILPEAEMQKIVLRVIARRAMQP